jgi:hypothetical protein
MPATGCRIEIESANGTRIKMELPAAAGAQVALCAVRRGGNHGAMIQIAPQMRILVAVQPVDVRLGCDGLMDCAGSGSTPIRSAARCSCSAIAGARPVRLVASPRA